MRRRLRENWKLKRKNWNVKRKNWNLKRKNWNVKRKNWNVKHKNWNMKRKNWNVKIVVIIFWKTQFQKKILKNSISTLYLFSTDGLFY